MNVSDPEVAAAEKAARAALEAMRRHGSCSAAKAGAEASKVARLQAPMSWEGGSGRALYLALGNVRRSGGWPGAQRTVASDAWCVAYIGLWLIQVYGLYRSMACIGLWLI